MHIYLCIIYIIQSTHYTPPPAFPEDFLFFFSTILFYLKIYIWFANIYIILIIILIKKIKFTF